MCANYRVLDARDRKLCLFSLLFPVEAGLKMQHLLALVFCIPRVPAGPGEAPSDGLGL